MAKTSTQKPTSPKPAEPETSATDPFEQAVAKYHERVRAAFEEYEKRRQDLVADYVESVQSAQRAKTPQLAQEILDAANTEAARGMEECQETANGAIAEGLSVYVAELKGAWQAASVEELDATKLACIGQESWFIANASVGAFPNGWWSPSAA